MPAPATTTTRSTAALRRLGRPDPRLLAALVDLEQRVHRASPAYDDEAWREEHFTLELPGKAELSVVALRDGAPAGFLVASRREGGVHVHRLAVDPASRREGIAARMLAEVLAGATGRVTVNCSPDNHAAIALYTAAGFRGRGRTPAGKLLLATATLPPPSGLRVWYVYTATGARAGHAAHLPGLVSHLARGCAATPVRYGDRADLPALARSPGWALAFARLLARARRERVDVVFVRIHWKLAALLRLAGRLGGGWRVVLWSSGGPGHLPGSASGPLARGVRLAHRLVLRHGVDAVVTGPPRLLAEYAERYRLRPDRMLLASNDVDVAGWRAAGDARQPEADHPAIERWLAADHRFVYVHGVDPIRGADRLPQLLAGLRVQLPGAQLLVLGDGPLLAGLADTQLLLAGRVANPVAAWVVARAHCMLVPSRQEGFPRVLLEAMALGTPCVSFAVGGCADVMGPLADRHVAPDGDLAAMVALAVAAARGRVARGPLPELVERAATFDTAPVAAALVATLRSLRAQGPAAAAWLSRALWRPAFAARPTSIERKH